MSIPSVGRSEWTGFVAHGKHTIHATSSSGEDMPNAVWGHASCKCGWDGNGAGYGQFWLSQMPVNNGIEEAVQTSLKELHDAWVRENL